MIFRMDYPPSVNHYWRNLRGRTVLSAAGRAYRDAAESHRRRRPLRGLVRVSLDVTLPDRRRRDLDNIIKAVLDAITHAGIWDDDCQVCQLVVTRLGVEPPGCVDVCIEEVSDE